MEEGTVESGAFCVRCTIWSRGNARRVVDTGTDDVRLGESGVDDRRAEDRRVEGRRVDDRRADDRREDDRRVDDRRVDDRRADDRRMDDRRADDRRAVYRRADARRADNWIAVATRDAKARAEALALGVMRLVSWRGVAGGAS